jgi:vitamin B12/bleomycin/antimicrobial peptide transport system ATP-binding/permease protein
MNKSEYYAGELKMDSKLASHIWSMLQAFWSSKARTKILAYLLVLVVVISVTIFGQLRLNAWNRPFYDAIAQKNVENFLIQLGVFCIIAGILLVLNVGQAWLTQAIKLKFRKGIVVDLLDEWLPRAHRLTHAGAIGANPDQRIHEDAHHLADLCADLGIGLFQSSLLLAAFIGVLWKLSENFGLVWHHHRLPIPGYMVWCALLYAIAASFLSWRVGKQLIPLNADRYAREAEFRFSLVYLNEHIEEFNGDAIYQKPKLLADLRNVLRVWWRIVNASARLTFVTAGYGWFTTIAPILAAAPGYFRGNLTFGQLMMVAAAFCQVQTSLRWFIDNFGLIADWRATLLRIAEFRAALIGLTEVERIISESQVSKQIVETSRKNLVIGQAFSRRMGEAGGGLEPKSLPEAEPIRLGFC